MAIAPTLPPPHTPTLCFHRSYPTIPVNLAANTNETAFHQRYLLTLLRTPTKRRSTCRISHTFQNTYQSTPHHLPHLKRIHSFHSGPIFQILCTVCIASAQRAQGISKIALGLARRSLSPTSNLKNRLAQPGEQSANSNYHRILQTTAGPKGLSFDMRRQ